MRYVLAKNSRRHSVIVKEFNPKTETFSNISYIGSQDVIALELTPTFKGCIVEYMGVEKEYIEGFDVRFIGLKTAYLDASLEPQLWQCDIYGSRFFEVLRSKREHLIAIASEMKIPISLVGTKDGLYSLNPFQQNWICSAGVLVKNGKIIDFVHSLGEKPEKLKISADGLSIVRTPSETEEAPVFSFE
jgi:hypothetical protein